MCTSYGRRTLPLADVPRTDAVLVFYTESAHNAFLTFRVGAQIQWARVGGRDMCSQVFLIAYPHASSCGTAGVRLDWTQGVAG